MAANTKAQQIAAQAMQDLFDSIQPGMTERDILDFCTERMTALGSDSWWYHGLPGLVLVGERSNLSIGGRDYIPDESLALKQDDIVNIDLAPTLQGRWGDYARTIVMQSGRAVWEPDDIHNAEFRSGIAAELALHQKLMEVCRADMTYEQVFEVMNREIDDIGYVNLDFKGNLGHSVEIDQKDRIYLEKGNTMAFAQCAKPFTLEPHIRAKTGSFGFKRENIYEFGPDGKLVCV